MDSVTVILLYVSDERTGPQRVEIREVKTTKESKTVENSTG